MLLRTTLVFDRGIEDVAVCSQDWWAEDTASFPTSAPNDYANITAEFQTFWGVMKAFYPPSLTFREVRYYREDDNTLPYGEVALVAPIGIAGTDAGHVTKGGGALPGQVACSVTKRTPSRRHWGRLFFPGFDRHHLETNGRWNNAAINNLGAQYALILNTVNTETVWGAVVINKDELPDDTGHHLTHVAVDDIPDVIRRRRAEGNLFQQVVAVNPHSP